jgi:bacterioferritin-associated ferredoxin
MFVCVCNAVTDREIRQCAELGASSLEEIRSCLGVATCCGKCEGLAHQILVETRIEAAAA